MGSTNDRQTEPDELVATYELHVDDLRAIAKSAANPLGRWVFAFAALYSAMLAVTGGAVVRVWVVLVLGAAMAAAIWWKWVLPRKQLAAMTDGEGPAEMVVRVDRSSVEVDSGQEAIRLALDRFSGYRVSNDHLILLVEDKPRLAIPCRKAGTDFIGELQNRLTANGAGMIQPNTSRVHRWIKILFPVAVVILAVLIYQSLTSEPTWESEPGQVIN